jgi:hypothetical protein
MEDDPFTPRQVFVSNGTGEPFLIAVTVRVDLDGALFLVHGRTSE